MREQLAEGAVVRMDRAAALLRMVLDVDLRRAVGTGDETSIRDDRERGRRHLQEGDGGYEEAAQEGTSAHWNRNIVRMVT
jgi:hypothetical protein